MANEPENDKGPACACGKADLYDEWLKQIEDKTNEVASIPKSQADDLMCSSDAAGKGDTEPVQTKE